MKSNPITVEPDLPEDDGFSVHAWMHLDTDTIDESFPMESYREGQKDAIEFAVEEFNKGKRIVVLEAPTGSGKSAIAMTIAEMVHDSYYLTITKQLQDQLTRDFSDVVELKGRNAYPCTYYGREGQKLVDRKLLSTEELNELKEQYPNCATGFCKTKLNRTSPTQKAYRCVRCFTVEGPLKDGKMSGELEVLPPGYQYSACPYYEQVYKALAARKITMNFSSFLFQTTMTKRFDRGARDLLIIDEAHNIESQILDFVSFSISDLHLQRYGVFIPELATPFDYYIWFEEAKVAKLLEDAIKQSRKDEKPKLEDELMRISNKFIIFMKRIRAAGTDTANKEWVSEYGEKGRTTTHRSVTIKPIFAHEFTEGLLLKHGVRILLMSATILDVNVLAGSLGIDKSEIAAYRMKNRFPVKNRPIYLDTVAKMTGGKGNMVNWAPQLVDGVNGIVRNHEGEKGIIHTHNFAIMDHLLTRCDPDVSDRMLCQRDFRNKTLMLEEHANRDDTIIVAPAMHEGIDLTDELSRFQIICKVPYANFFESPQLARRVELDRRYYTWMTALKLVQSYGRSIRSENDHAVTYILDEAIYRFLREADGMLPGWFKEAIKDSQTDK